jgi:hypothetical protein
LTLTPRGTRIAVCPLAAFRDLIHRFKINLALPARLDRTHGRSPVSFF